MIANLAAWLLAISGPIVKKVLWILGIGTITYASITALVEQVISQAQNYFGQIGGTSLQFLSLAGIPDVMGIIGGALLARASFVVLKKLGSVKD